MKSTGVLFFFICAALFGQHTDFEEVSFVKADSIALSHKGESLKNLPLLTFKLTSQLTNEIEKFRAIYTWVCTNIENDYGAYKRTIKKRKKLLDDKEALTEWNNSITPKVFKKLVDHKKTACTGYAYLVRELARLADINCKIVNGYGRTPTLILDNNSIPNHAWNAVELDGKWYLCDPTWSAGRIVLEDDGPRFEADYFDGYFLSDPALFIKNHYPLDTTWSMLQKAPDFNVFLDGPVVYKSAFRAQITPVMPSLMQQEIRTDESITFSMKSNKILADDSFSLVLSTGSSTKHIEPKVLRDRNLYTLEHTFNKSGKYDVHLKVDDDLIATYVVRVKRK